MKENEMTVRLNEETLLEIIKFHYKKKDFVVFDHQFYEDEGFVYAEFRMKEDTGKKNEYNLSAIQGDSYEPDNPFCCE